MPLPYPTKVVLPFDIATAQDMNERHANDVALSNGTGLDDGAVTPEKRSGGIAKGSFTSAVGDYTVNTLNFRPTSVEFIASLTSSNNVSSLSTGFMIEGGGQECVAIAASASSPASTHSRSYDDRCISLLSYSGGSFGNFGIGTFVSMNDDGFTINMSSATTTNFTIKWIARR